MTQYARRQVFQQEEEELPNRPLARESGAACKLPLSGLQALLLLRAARQEGSSYLQAGTRRRVPDTRTARLGGLHKVQSSCRRAVDRLVE